MSGVKQRYECKDCNKNYTNGDKRIKYDDKIKLQAITMSLNNCGQRAIGRILKIPYQYVSNWVKNGVDIVKQKIEAEKESKIEKVEILELYPFNLKMRVL
jgi:transposase-like protein